MQYVNFDSVDPKVSPLKGFGRGEFTQNLFVYKSQKGCVRCSDDIGDNLVSTTYRAPWQWISFQVSPLHNDF